MPVARRINLKPHSAAGSRRLGATHSSIATMPGLLRHSGRRGNSKTNLRDSALQPTVGVPATQVPRALWSRRGGADEEKRRATRLGRWIAWEAERGSRSTIRSAAAHYLHSYVLFPCTCTYFVKGENCAQRNVEDGGVFCRSLRVGAPVSFGYCSNVEPNKICILFGVS
jgi:hypothetical protein